VLATPGDTHLGGDDFDKKIVDYLAEEFRQKALTCVKTNRLCNV